MNSDLLPADARVQIIRDQWQAEIDAAAHWREPIIVPQVSDMMAILDELIALRATLATLGKRTA